MDETETTAVLPGVTGLTGLPDWSDRSEPENRSSWLKEERIVYKRFSLSAYI